jgi:hypothetical protein
MSFMSHYHVAHIIPKATMHGLNGYKEVIESVRWGLERLGHHVSYGINEIANEATNIVFGAQVMRVNALAQLPKNTIIYNLEQLRGLKEIRQEIRYFAAAKHFQIWEYSDANMEAWSTLGRGDVRLVPIAYAPILSRIPKAPHQDIDVLIYGLAGERRLNVFHVLSQRGAATLFVSGLYGAARDDLISRSKIVLNVSLYHFAGIFEIVRVSYLLANKKAVVSDLGPNTSIENDVRGCVKFASSLQEMISVCFQLLENEKERTRLEEVGFVTIRQRDIRTILERAL